MDFIIQGLKNFIAVILGSVLYFYPANSPPSPLPSVPPNLQDSLTSVYSSPSPTPIDTSSTPTAVPSQEEIIKISDSQSYYGNTIEYSIEFPRKGGAVKGFFRGTCNGIITGNYAGGDGGNIDGNATGECNILFLKPKINITYQGNVFLGDKKITVNWTGEAPFGLKNGSITLLF